MRELLADAALQRLILQATVETLYMVGFSLAIALVCGLPLGVLLVVTAPGHILPQPKLNAALSSVINAGRSIPFIILLFLLMPVTKLLVGVSIGTRGAIVPLAVAAIPFVARVVESSLQEVDPGVIEAAQAMGASPVQIIFKVLLPEAWPTLLLGFTLTAINLVGYSAMAGAIGGGGLGDIAIRYGYQRFRDDVLLETVVILIALVQAAQSAGNWLARRAAKDQRRFNA
ncbi:MAG: D-methionine transport system permease protein [Bacillota bacterium]|nr:D-methionine transport system permease protein [Bacillota bacterium]MDK2855691.1 D-methionine transport system permease protein [Bacillota bacterium]MDK2924915.1 D-methionine transport system permease protein [Bacillota bacterium]